LKIDAGECFAVSAPGIEQVTSRELTALGASVGSMEPGGVTFPAGRELVYRANLELRTASRVLLRLGGFEARTWFELERHGAKLPWDAVLVPGMAPEFEVTSRKSKLYHQRGIAERLHRLVGEAAPAGAPAQKFVVRVVRDRFTISADSSGELLHRRGYRLETGKAPLRETLAAAMLLACGWDGTAALLDPFAGSGTIPIEAALIAQHVAPGIARRFAFEQWPGFDGPLWDRLRSEARAREQRTAGPLIGGSDRDAGAIESAKSNAARAGVEHAITFHNAPLSALQSPREHGLLLTNPPYGARVGEESRLRDLYAQLGNVSRQRLAGWRIALLSASARLEGQLGLPMEELWRTSNGGIPVHLMATPA
jgi:putative N6-adenine-specific DNA methylase